MLTSASGEALVLGAAVAAISMGQGKSATELELLAAFLAVVADNLALMAGQLPENVASPVDPLV